MLKRQKPRFSRKGNFRANLYCHHAAGTKEYGRKEISFQPFVYFPLAMFSSALLCSRVRWGQKRHHLPAQPQFKGICRAMVRSVKEGCLSHIIGERSLCRAVAEYVEHYHQERNHQGRGNVLIFSSPLPERKFSCMSTAERLGVLLKYYHQAA